MKLRLLALICFIAALTAGCMSDSDLQHKIEAKVKPGASVQEIEAYLNTDGKKLDIESPGVLTDASRDSVLRDRQVSADTPVYQTILRGNPDFLIYFFAGPRPALSALDHREVIHGTLTCERRRDLSREAL